MSLMVDISGLDQGHQNRPAQPAHGLALVFWNWVTIFKTVIYRSVWQTVKKVQLFRYFMVGWPWKMLSQRPYYWVHLMTMTVFRPWRSYTRRNFCQDANQVCNIVNTFSLFKKWNRTESKVEMIFSCQTH